MNFFHSGPHWLNDALIGFYFEFLHQRKFESSSRICFISPEVSQFLKLASAVEIPVFLDPLHLEEKETVLMAVNNASDPSQPGGSHWSLLIFTRQECSLVAILSCEKSFFEDHSLCFRVLYLSSLLKIIQ